MKRIPTHKPIRLTLVKPAKGGTKTILQTLPSLRTIFHTKVEEKTKDLATVKEKKLAEEAFLHEIHNEVNNMLATQEPKLIRMAQEADTTKLWQNLAEIFEGGILKLFW